MIVKTDEIEMLKRNIKITKISEIEVEMRAYIDECTRLKHQLEEVIKSKDTFADPEELRVIEERFSQQDNIIATLRNENQQLAQAFAVKEEEASRLRDLAVELEKRCKKAQGNAKEGTKHKKAAKEKERDLHKLRNELTNYKAVCDEQRFKIDELGKKKSV